MVRTSHVIKFLAFTYTLLLTTCKAPSDVVYRSCAWIGFIHGLDWIGSEAQKSFFEQLDCIIVVFLVEGLADNVCRSETRVRRLGQFSAMGA